MTTTPAPLAAPILPRLQDLLGLLAGVQPGPDQGSRSAKIVQARDDLVAMLAAPPAPLVLELNDHTQAILGRANFQCARMAALLRADGQQIPAKSENEQAAVICYLLNFYFKHGADWGEAVSADLERINAARAAGAQS